MTKDFINGSNGWIFYLKVYTNKPLCYKMYTNLFFYQENKLFFFIIITDIQVEKNTKRWG